MSVGIGNDLFQIVGVSDISGLAEKLDGGNDVDTLDIQVLGSIGRVDRSLATLLNIENLMVSGNTVTLTAAQLGAFESISGSFLYDRFQIGSAGIVDMTNATVNGIGQIRGNAGADTCLFASATGNILVNMLGEADNDMGGDGNVVQPDGGGNDTLDGGTGADLVTKRGGADNLTGGAGADVFAFDDLSEMGTGAARDVIVDVVHGQDINRLTGVDAELNPARGSAIHLPRRCSYCWYGGAVALCGGVLSGDVGGDGTADFQIGLTGAPIRGVADFHL